MTVGGTNAEATGEEIMADFCSHAVEDQSCRAAGICRGMGHAAMVTASDGRWEI